MKLTSDTTEGKIVLAVAIVICLLIIILGAAKLQDQHRLIEAPVTSNETTMSTSEPTTTEATTTTPTTTEVTTTSAPSTTVAPVTTTASATTKTPSTTKTVIANSTVATTKATTVESTTVSNRVTLGSYTITAYCPCRQCSGQWGRSTASGATATAGRTIATSNSFPFGTKLYIEGLGTYTVEDRGGAVQGRHIDVFFNTHSEAAAFGRQTRVVSRVG